MMTSWPTILTTGVGGLLSMAFLTLSERKILSYSQARKGPNKPSFVGILQPLSDAFKLLSKEMIVPLQTNKGPFVLSSLLMLLIALVLWSLVPPLTNPTLMKLSIIIFLCLSSVSVYTTLSASWTSNSKYALLGSARGVAQTISYEVTMALIMINMLSFLPNYNFNKMMLVPSTMLMMLNPMSTTLWFICMLAELNRAPFDLIEGESELVSGFNTEFSSSLFTMIFMAEYLNIMFMSGLTFILIFNMSKPLFLSMAPIQCCFVMIIILSRASYPRVRYDSLMSMNWIYFLPTTIISILLLSMQA